MAIRNLLSGVIGLSLLIFTMPASVPAGMVAYDLTIAREMVNITGKPAHGMTINGEIPGPTLRFNQGDTARIKVHNHMPAETSIHWHGILVPPDMDGVPYISFPPIRAGETFVYEFPIRQSGTYWYHSHTSLQEQSGVYGAIVIAPPQERLHPDREYVVVLSDWTDENPDAVLRTLKRGSEWYALQKGSGQSILGAARLARLGDYFKRELQRMPPMDIADVAYDRFLANGNSQIGFAGHPGETVRLRIIDGSATTYFHLEFAGGSMQIIAADGLTVEPVEQDRFLIGVAETYDVLVKIPTAGAFELRATAYDGSGHASVWIGSGKRHFARDVPRPNLYMGMGDLGVRQILALTPAGAMGMPDREVAAGKFDRPGMAGMGHMHGMQGGPPGAEAAGMKMDGMMMDRPSGTGRGVHQTGRGTDHERSSMETMAHGDQKKEMIPATGRSGKSYGRNFGLLAADVSAAENLAVDGSSAERPWPPYDKLRAPRPTALDEKRPKRDIRLTLDGDMKRYVWFLNNKPLSESDAIHIRKGEIVRFIMINRTMMHHPMHLHGHFFRVLNGQGDHAPLKHTVDVAPMSTTVIEFDANEVGDWFFHCHLLYHMKSGMARMVHYEDFTISPQLAAVRPDLYRESWYLWGRADVLSNMTEGFLLLSDTRNIFSAKWKAGWQEVNATEWEAILSYERYFNRFFRLFAGVDVMGEGDESDETRGVFGLRYLLPLNLESRTWVDTDGGVRITLEKEFQLTPRLALMGEVEYDSHDLWEGKVGLHYTLAKNISIAGQWHTDFGWGGGIQVRF